MVAPHGGGYAFAAGTVVSGWPADVVAWLLEPDRLVRWTIGVDRLEEIEGAPGTIGSRVRARTVYRGSWSTGYVGELTERSGDRVTRRYQPENGPGAAPATAGTWRDLLSEPPYVRTVRHQLSIHTAGTALTTTVEVEIPGMSARASRWAAKAEQRGLQRTLGRLSAVAAGRRVGVVARMVDTRYSPQLL